MVKPDEGKVLDVDGIDKHRLFTDKVHLVKLGLPHLEQGSLRQTYAML